MSTSPMIFAGLLFVSLLVFCAGCYRRFSLISLGQPEERLNSPVQRLMQLLRHAFAQKRVVGRSFGLNHAIIFWSFLVLLLANAEFVIRGLFPGFSMAFLPATLRHGLLLAFDLASLLSLAGALLAMARRLFFPPPAMSSTYVKARSPEAFIILALIILLMLAYFGLHGTEIALGLEQGAAAMPVSSLAARLLATSVQRLDLAAFFWWLHAVALLGFLCFLPGSKHMHILTAIPNIFLGTLSPVNTQPREDFARGNSYGAATVADFTWKDLLDGFSCTECGRCQSSCPAASTGKTLNPRQLIHAIKTNLLANGALLRRGKAAATALIGPESETSTSEETIWACTTCGACMNACPVLIEHMPKIVKLRRHLVQMKSSFPQELLTLFENMEGRSNPWGIAPGERTKWHAGMDVKSFEAGKTEYLFFTGCAGAFDSRQKHATLAMASILNAAGVSWGVLGRDEPCCGDSLRRLGNEYVFDRMTRDNIRLFKERGVSKIITQCPHCFSTLKNDYHQYGAELEIIHHSQFISALLADNRLELKHPAAGQGKILFHDSCYLGRHNNIYAAPRDTIRLATGKAPTEFVRSGGDSFCCGAGGGRMWQEELSGERINLNRLREALEQEPDTICVSCPYCMTMMEDGLKDLQANDIKVMELAEVVAGGI